MYQFSGHIVYYDRTPSRRMHVPSGPVRRVDVVYGWDLLPILNCFIYLLLRPTSLGHLILPLQS